MTKLVNLIIMIIKYDLEAYDCLIYIIMKLFLQNYLFYLIMIANMVSFPEVKTQDYIYFNNGTTTTAVTTNTAPAIRPAVCQLETVNNWHGKTITLKVGDECTVTITNYDQDYDESGFTGDCNDSEWEKKLDKVKNVLTIQSKASITTTGSNWPLECSVTISNTDNDGKEHKSTDRKWIYRHDPEINLYPLINVGGTPQLHYNPLTCNLYKVPDEVLEGTLGNTTEAGKLTLEYNQSGDEEITCSFTFDDTSQDTNFTITRTASIKMFSCINGFRDDPINHTCVACSAGYKGDGHGGCVECVDQKYQPNYGAVKCLPCEGTVTKSKTGELNTGCEADEASKKCAQGKYRDDTGCKDCPAGKYSDKVNDKPQNKKCVSCPTGSVAETAGSWLCRQCPKGSKAVDNKCQLCDRGEYQHEAGQTTCNKCTGDKNYTSYQGAEWCSECPTVSYKVDTNEDNANYDCSAKPEKKDCTGVTVDEFADSVGPMVFGPVGPDTWSKVACPNNKGSSASLRCIEGFNKWDMDNIDISQCESKVSGEVQKFKNNEVTSETMNKLAEKTNIIAPSDVENMAKTLKTKVSDSVKETSNPTKKLELAKSGLALISNISLSTSVTKSSEDSRLNMVEATENIVDALLDDDDVDIPGDSFDVKIVRNSEGNIAASDNVTISGLTSVGICMYKKNTLFKEPEDETRGGSDVATQILGSVIGLKSKNASPTFQLSVTSDLTDDDRNTEKTVEVRCKWYVAANLSWSTKGCNTTSVETEDGTRVTKCDCNHMTSFAIIMSVENTIANQDAFSNVMLIVNIVFCLLTLLCIAPFKVFRQKKLMFIQIQILLCLVALSTALLVLGNKSFKEPYNKNSCKALVFIIHYLLISLFAWSVCAAFTLKDQIVDALKSYGRKDNWYLVRCLCFCWGLPVLVPTATIIFSNTLTLEYEAGVNYPKLHYIRELHCWYSESYLYATVLGPIYLCFIIIVAWYIMVLRVIVNASRNGSSQGSNKKTLKAAFAIACTVGLPWIIHPFVPHRAVAEILQWLFMLSVGLQGLGIFICAVLLQDEVLSKVCHTLRLTPPSCLMKAKTYRKKTEPKNNPNSTQSMSGKKSTDDSLVLSRPMSNIPDKNMYSSELTTSDLVTVGQSMPDHTYNDLGASSSVFHEDDEKPLPPPPAAALTNDQVFVAHGDPNIRFVGGVRIVSFNDFPPDAGLEDSHYENHEFQPPFL